ncbi:3'-5' exonuclease [Methylocella sp.]|uniref:3'-5' exonuclease n=1 Tax=Methylocella sp. TaxID=1978226 RepID=UPI0037846DC1
MRLALAHEAEAAPSLSCFLALFESTERSVKRDMEAGGDAARVMTVHAAKGLEAKIVFLPDACNGLSAQHDPKIFALEERHLGRRPVLWSPRRAEDCAEAALARARARELAEDEYRRLLYVALTRAEERLYIAGFHGAKDPPALSWARMIEATLGADGRFEEAEAFWSADEKVLRLVVEAEALGAGRTAPAAPSGRVPTGWRKSSRRRKRPRRRSAPRARSPRPTAAAWR